MKIVLTTIVFALSFISPGLVSTSLANEMMSPAPADAHVYFISPKDGQTVPQTFKLQFGLTGMGVAPAGVDQEKTGHHHLLIDTDIKTLDLSKPLPANDNVKHFGGGQTETELTLSPGKHTLQLLLGNYLHIPHNKPVVSKKITVTVE